MCIRDSGVAEAQVENEVIEAGLFVAFGIASDIRRSSCHQQTFDVCDRGECAGRWSHPSFFGRSVAFIDQTLDVNLAERDVAVLIEAGDGDGAGGDHGSSRKLALLFEVLDHLVKRGRGYTSGHPAVAV